MNTEDMLNDNSKHITDDDREEEDFGQDDEANAAFKDYQQRMARKNEERKIKKQKEKEK